MQIKAKDHGVAGIARAPRIKQQEAEPGSIQSLGACTEAGPREADICQGDRSCRAAELTCIERMAAHSAKSGDCLPHSLLPRVEFGERDMTDTT